MAKSTQYAVRVIKKQSNDNGKPVASKPCFYWWDDGKLSAPSETPVEVSKGELGRVVDALLAIRPLFVNQDGSGGMTFEIGRYNFRC